MDLPVYEIAKKLIGPVSPIGETNEDERRFENLKVMIELVDQLLGDIDLVAMKKDRAEYSVKKAGVFAATFFDRLGIQE